MPGTHGALSWQGPTHSPGTLLPLALELPGVLGPDMKGFLQEGRGLVHLCTEHLVPGNGGQPPPQEEQQGGQGHVRRHRMGIRTLSLTETAAGSLVGRARAHPRSPSCPGLGV